jgi:hypothetical protein
MHDGEPVFLAIRLSSSAWEFHRPDHLDAPPELVQCALEDIAAVDPSVGELSSLPPGWHAWKAAPDAPWSRAATPSGYTFMVTFEARPSVPPRPSEPAAGAFVKCWVREHDRDRAVALAHREVQSAGWTVLEQPHVERVDEHRVRGDDRAFFRQAQLDGCVLVFHTFPGDGA